MSGTALPINASLLDEVRWLIECEEDCIRSGNVLTPMEQQIALAALENLRARIRGHFG